MDAIQTAQRVIMPSNTPNTSPRLRCRTVDDSSACRRSRLAKSGEECTASMTTLLMALMALSSRCAATSPASDDDTNTTRKGDGGFTTSTLQVDTPTRNICSCGRADESETARIMTTTWHTVRLRSIVSAYKPSLIERRSRALQWRRFLEVTPRKMSGRCCRETDRR